MKVALKFHQTIYFLAALVLFISCGGSESAGEAENLQNFERLDQMVENREFIIENRWALPLGGNMINLIDNPNIIKFDGENVNVQLPYFGVRHAGGGYGSGEAGIKFEGPVEDFTVDRNTGDNNILLRFEGQQGTENLRFIITVYPDGSANTSVSSSQRDPISYRGNIKPLPIKR